MENKTLNASGGIRSHLKGYLKEQAIPIGVLLCMIVIGSLLTPMFLTSLNLQISLPAVLQYGSGTWHVCGDPVRRY